MTRTAAVATPHVLATEAGRAALLAGGNAIDAALAAAITTAVVYPHNTAIGGDVVALVRTPDGRVRCVNATGWAPGAVDRAALRERHGGRLPARGIDSVTVPGAPAGWRALHDLGARLPWSAHFDAAIRLAAGGFAASHSLAYCTALVWPELAGDPGLDAVFAPEGRPVMRGETVSQPALADTLRTVARDGIDAFYRGDIADTLVAALRDRGGVFDADDFRGFEAQIVEPLARDWLGMRVHTSPPNTQGFALLRTLRSLDVDTDALALAARFIEGNALRTSVLGDPRAAEVDADHLVDADLDPVTASAVADPRVPKGDTIGLSAADDEGFGVSLIQSVFQLFGSGILEPETGVILQNRGSAFSLDEDSPNAISGGARPAHTLMPVIVTRDGALRYVNASMGGSGQPQIHAHLLQRLLEGANPQQAVDAPRWILGPNRPGDRDDTVYAESGVPDAAVAALVAAGHPVVAVPDHTELLGHANVVAIDADGAFAAGSDIRADGSAVVMRSEPTDAPLHEPTPT